MGTLVAFADPAAVVEQQPVEPALVIRLAQQRADALQEGGLLSGRQVIVGPGLGRQCLGARLVLLSEAGGGKRRQADRRGRLLAGEEGLDLCSARRAVEQRLLGALDQQTPIGPGWALIQEGANFARRAEAGTIEIPVDQLACRGITDLVARRARISQIALGRRLEGRAQACRLVAGQGQVADRGNGRIVARNMRKLALGRTVCRLGLLGDLRRLCRGGSGLLGCRLTRGLLGDGWDNR